MAMARLSKGFMTAVTILFNASVLKIPWIILIPIVSFSFFLPQLLFHARNEVPNSERTLPHFTGGSPCL